MKNFPRQRLSFSEKSKDDYQWAKDTADNLFAFSYSTGKKRSDFDRMVSNYKLFNNELDQQDFERECEPLGLQVGQFQDEIQPYNKTYNKIQVLLRDEFSRPFNYKAVLVNADGIKSKLSHQDYLLRQFVNEQLQTTIQQVLPNFDPKLIESSGSTMDPKEIKRYMNTTYLEAREILANKLLKLFEKSLSIKELKNDGFKHALLSGYEFTYVGVNGDNPTIEILNPLGVFFHKSPETKYIQDGLYAGYRTYMDSGTILDRFSSYMTTEEIEKIDHLNIGALHTLGNFDYSDYYNASDGDHLREGSYGDSSNNANDWLVQHVEWRSQKKVGFINFMNEYGEPQMELVSEDFEIPSYATKEIITEEYDKKTTYYTWKDIEGNPYAINWGWVPEVWTTTRIGEDIYVMIGPKKNQFRSIDDPFTVRLGYHGLAYSSMNADPISLMDRMKPFQYLYFIVAHKLKKLIAQDKGKIFHFDTTMLDPKLGWEKTLYYLTQMNIDFFNPLQNADTPGWSQRGKVTGSTDMSTGNHIMNYVNLLNAIDGQISDVAGVSRQREGQVGPTEAVTNAQSNIQMSAVITEVYFHTHNKLWEKVLSSFIQVVQEVYKNKSLTKQFVLDDMSIQTLEISPDTFLNTDLGVFVSDSPKEEEVFEVMKSLLQPLIQNDKATFSDLIKTMKSSSLEEVESFILESEKNAIEFQQKMQAQQAEAQQRLAQEDQSFKLEYQARELASKEYIAEMDTFKFLQDQDSDDNGIPDQFEVEKFKAELGLKAKKLSLEELKTKNEIRQRDLEIEIKKRKPTK